MKISLDNQLINLICYYIFILLCFFIIMFLYYYGYIHYKF